MTISRRRFLNGSLATAALAAAAGGHAADINRDAADPRYCIRNHGIRHSLMGWCFKPMDTLDLARHAKEIGNRTQVLSSFTNNPREAAIAHREKRAANWDPL
jgi:hypothetical protein